MILGCILTVCAEIAAVMTGVHAVSDTLQGFSSKSSGSSSDASEPFDPNSPCKDEQFSKDHSYQCDPWTQRFEDYKAHHPEKFGFQGEQPP